MDRNKARERERDTGNVRERERERQKGREKERERERERVREREKAGIIRRTLGLPCLARQKVLTVDTKGTKAIWARRLRYIQGTIGAHSPHTDPATAICSWLERVGATDPLRSPEVPPL